MEPTPLAAARHRIVRLHRHDETGRLLPVGPAVEALTGRCIEPPGRRPMTYVVLPAGRGARPGDRLVDAEPADERPTIRLEYRVPADSTRDTRLDFNLDALGWHGGRVEETRRWLAGHDLWMGRAVRM